MTQEIIEMARQAKLLPIEIGPVVETSRMRNKIAMLEAFAKLVAAKKHQELYRLAEDAPVRGDARETRQNILHAIRAKGEP